LGSHEPSGQTPQAQPKFKSLQTMLGGYKVNILGAFWGRAARHSRTCPFSPGARGLRRRWGGRAGVQRLAVGEWGWILPPKRMNWDQRDIVTHAYPGLRRLLRPPGGGLGEEGGRARARARVRTQAPTQHHLPGGGCFSNVRRGEGFYSTQKKLFRGATVAWTDSDAWTHSVAFDRHRHRKKNIRGLWLCVW